MEKLFLKSEDSLLPFENAIRGGFSGVCGPRYDKSGEYNYTKMQIDYMVL